MVPGAIDTPELDPVHIDMGVTMPLDILQPGGLGVEGEVGGDDIEVPAGSGVAVDSCIERRPGGPVIHGDDVRGFGLMRHAALLGRHRHALRRSLKLEAGPHGRSAEKRAADECHQQASGLRARLLLVCLCCFRPAFVHHCLPRTSVYSDRPMPAPRISPSAASSEPSRSMARQAGRMTSTLKPCAAPSSADQATQ